MTRHSRPAGDRSQINQNSSAMNADHRSNCGRLVEIDRAWKETRRVIAVVSVCVSLMDKAAAAAAAAAVRAILNCRSDRAPKASRRRQACRSMSCRVAGHLRDYLPTHWRGVVAQWPGVGLTIYRLRVRSPASARLRDGSGQVLHIHVPRRRHSSLLSWTRCISKYFTFTFRHIVAAPHFYHQCHSIDN